VSGRTATRGARPARRHTLAASVKAPRLKRVPRAAWICALVAFLNAACWSLVTYAFQAPDEPSHFAYVKQLAETGSLPTVGLEGLSSEELLTLDGLRSEEVREEPQNRAIVTQAEQSQLRRDLAAAQASKARGSPGAGVAASEPPLYYAVEAIPYILARHASVLARLQLMRLTSALMAGLTALFVFMFVREVLPAAPPWAWTVAGLAIALTPLLGFMSGAVNPDSLLFAVSAAIFYALARAFRRGLDTAGAVTIGALLAIGFLTKVNFLGLVPGILVGLAVLAARAARVAGRSAYRMLAIALAIAFSPGVIYVSVNALSHHPLFGLVSDAIQTVHGSPFAELNYIWQFYLPRLPGTVDDFPGLVMAQQLWFRGYVGLYGWFDTTFPAWVYSVALIPTGAVALLCGHALFQRRGVLRARAVELAVYACICVGLMALVAADSYHEFPGLDAAYAQVRYLLPLLSLLGPVLALAALGAGRRWGPIVGTVIVILFLAHDLFSQLLVVARYYG
jgi:4-amino-4-deoxy-L-arabinose transferase-like glycosyltransferase